MGQVRSMGFDTSTPIRADRYTRSRGGGHPPGSPIAMIHRFALGLIVLFAPAWAWAETCLSPYVKRLDRPEKYLYLFCVDADAKDDDFLAVIDVESGSPNYG